MAAGHVVNFRSLVHHLVHGERDEIAKHDVDDWTQSRHRGTDCHARETSLGDRRINHSRRAEFFHQSRQNLERRPGLGHIFADDAHTGIAAHLLGQRFPHRLRKCELALRHKHPDRLVPRRDKALQ